MKFNLIQPIECGNAVRLVVQSTAGEARWRVLRKEANTFTAYNDPAAYVVHDGNERFLTDARLLVNGAPYFYALYGYDGTAWLAPVIATVTPQSTFATDAILDAQEIVRERVDVTLHSMISRGLVALSKTTVPVMSIPFYQQGTDLPVVTVLFGGATPATHGIGNDMATEAKAGDQWVGYQGWHQIVNLDITAWSLNAQERNALRVALETVIAANLDIFDSLGLNLIDVQNVQDSEDFQSMNVPIYQTVLRIGCQIVVAVTEAGGSLGDIEITNLGA